MFGSKINPAGAANDLGDPIENSIRLNDDDSAHTAKTFSTGSAQTTFCGSAWVRRGNLGLTAPAIMGSYKDSSNLCMVYFNASDNLVVICKSAGAFSTNMTTSSVFRDTNGWYHVYFQVDSTTGDSSVWVNNVEQPLVTPVKNSASDTYTFGENVEHWVGRLNNGVTNYYFDGEIAECHLVIGSTLSPESFGRYSASHPNVWVPITPSGITYGSNGFYLDFAVAPGTGNGAGTDVSGNNNHFTDSGLTSDDQLSDTPSNVFAVFNALDKGSSAVLAEGGLKQTAVTDHIARATLPIPATGKWAFSGKVNAGDFSFGVCTPEHGLTTKIGRSNFSWGAIDAPGASFFRSEHDSVGTNSTVISAANDTFVVAYDADTMELWLGRNDGGAGIAYLGGGDPAAGTTPTYTLTSGDLNGKSLFFAIGRQLSASFGQIAHYETLPTGFNELSQANLPNVVTDLGGVDLPGEHFAIGLHTGNATSPRSFTGTGFQPDVEWIKDRSGPGSGHLLFDVLRGAENALFPGNSAAEINQPGNGYLTSFDTDGTSYENGSVGDNNYNDNTNTYVRWQWLMGGAGVSNTDGTITSTVSASSTGAWSLITWTGTGANGTIGHGLSGAPELVLVKNTNDSRAWRVLETAVNGGTHYLTLDTTAASTAGSTFWNNTNPTSSVIHLGSDTDTNDLGDTMLAIAFRSVPGICKVGVYTGNLNVDGPHIDCGFAPTFFLQKLLSGVNNWAIWDRSRDIHNEASRTLSPNLSTAEDTTYKTDFLSTGMKIRSAHQFHNTSGGTHIFLAIAESAIGGGIPFPNAR